MSQKEFKEPPADGVYVYGIYLDGARWDEQTEAIGESIPKKLYSAVPMVRQHLENLFFVFNIIFL